MSLEFGHGEFFLRELPCKIVCECILTFVESEKKIGHLLVAGVVQVGMIIGPTRSQECRVKFFSMISSHEQDPTFLRSDTIKGIEKT